MTSYGINVCYATSTVPVEIPHLKYQISFKNTICDAVINKYYKLQHMKSCQSHKKCHPKTLTSRQLFSYLCPAWYVWLCCLLCQWFAQSGCYEQESWEIFLCKQKQVLYKFVLHYFFFSCASYKHHVCSIDWFLKTRLVNRHAQTYISQFTTWFPSISRYCTAKACQSYWIRNSNIWHNLW